jgi:hypothetical protein
MRSRRFPARLMRWARDVLGTPFREQLAREGDGLHCIELGTLCPRLPANPLRQSNEAMRRFDAGAWQFDRFVADIRGRLLLDTSLGWTLRGRDLIYAANWSIVEQAPDYPRPSIVKWLVAQWRHRSVEELIWLPFGTGNYYHFLVDMLGGLKLIHEHLEVTDLPVLISRKLWDSAFFQQYRAASTLLTNARWIVHEEGEWIRTSRLVTAKSWFSGIETFRDAIGLLDRLPAPTSAPTRRLFLTRDPAAGRIPSNEGELGALLAERGFEAVRFEGLTLVEQIELVNSGATFVAVHGAGMANLAFHRAPRSVKLFEVTPSDLINPCFAFMSDEAGMDYFCFAGGPRDFDREEAFDVPLGPFTEALDRFLAS